MTKKFLEIYGTEINSPKNGLFRYRIIAIERIKKNYITVDYECSIKYHNPEDAFFNFMQLCDEDLLDILLILFYKNDNSLIVCKRNMMEITTKIFHKKFVLDSTNLKSISNYIASLEIDWSKIKYPHADSI